MSTWFRSYGFAEVFEGLLIGSYPLDEDDVAMLHWAGVDRVLNLVENDEYRRGERDAVERAMARNEIEEYRLSLPDFGGMPPEMIDRAVALLDGWIADGHHVYVHCRAGRQRSPAIAAALVALRDGIDVDDALELVRVRKPSADPLPHQRDDLWRWYQDRIGGRGPTPRPAAGAP